MIDEVINKPVIAKVNEPKTIPKTGVKIRYPVVLGAKKTNNASTSKMKINIKSLAVEVPTSLYLGMSNMQKHWDYALDNYPQHTG